MPKALAVPPLVPAADIAQPDLKAWWQEGDFIVAVTDSPGKQAMRPLVNPTPIPLPNGLESYEQLGVQCQDTPVATGTYGGVPIVGVVTGDGMSPKVQILRDGRPIAENLLGRPASICEMRLAQADTVPGLELIVAWQINTEIKPIKGFTIYRIPEALDPSPRKPTNDTR
ncbi:MAG: hypothetical protein ACPGTU_12900 [Myxococcota bacterium]